MLPELASSAPPSSVNFPLSEPAAGYVGPVKHTRPPYLPFRRISLPTAPSLMHRESVVSVASFDSLPEEGEGPIGPVLARNTNAARKTRNRPTISDSPRKGNKRREVSAKPRDDLREAKRRKIVEEFYETERAYVDGLELIYSHFLTPIINSLNTPNPLLDRQTLTSVFSNFIDIWNLHRSFLSSLSTLLANCGILPSSASASAIHHDTPPLSPLLLSHFPYLSLYNPFVTAFPSTISSLSNLVSPPTPSHPNSHYNPAFSSFLSVQEADPRCGKLKFRDWLLTIVQRCPRYLLLLKDLINCTDPNDPEHDQLKTVHTLVSKITLSLNTSLHTHAQTLALLSLQRSTPNLPFQLIVPGRTLLKRGALIQVERSVQPREREFLLFSDCLLWLAGEETERAWGNDWGIGRGGWIYNNTGDTPGRSSGPIHKPPMMRSRSKSEAEISLLKSRVAAPDSDAPTSGSPLAKSALPPARKSYYHPTSNAIKRHASSNNGEERWVYKGRAELVDLEVIVSPPRDLGEERRFEILSPEGSFVLYAGSEQERDEWSSLIRQAKSQLLISLNVTHPNSTLTSSTSTNHLRRSLQALPFPPSDARIATVRGSPLDGRKKGKAKGSSNVLQERRSKVEHWVPAIWIPDEKTEGCMRCGRTFGWRRRRHHCRLCGRCVCAACSSRTFFISDPTTEDGSSKPARACDACYETVFPLLNPPSASQDTLTMEQVPDTITSLTNFPSWLSMPSLPVPVPSAPQALMAIDPNSPKRTRSRPTSRISDPGDLQDLAPGERVRLKSHSRPRSSYQILEDFEDREGKRAEPDVGSLLEEESGEGEDNECTRPEQGPSHASCEQHHYGHPSSSPSPPRKEDTARRNKRFSLPAVAIQTTNVTARTHQPESGNSDPSLGAISGGGVKKRFSLVLGTRGHGVKEIKGQDRPLAQEEGEREGGGKGKGQELGKGVAAVKLSELLGRRRG